MLTVQLNSNKRNSEEEHTRTDGKSETDKRQWKMLKIQIANSVENQI